MFVACMVSTLFQIGFIIIWTFQDVLLSIAQAKKAGLVLFIVMFKSALDCNFVFEVNVSVGKRETHVIKGMP